MEKRNTLVACKPFANTTKIIRKRLPLISKNKSVGPSNISGQILNLGEALSAYIALMLDIIINNATISRDWEKTTVVPICERSDRSLVSNYRPISLPSVIGKKMNHVT
jgi:hypothetical protein